MEAALISSLPPQMRCGGSYSERWARIGNAVQPPLTRAIATHLYLTVLAPGALVQTGVEVTRKVTPCHAT